MGMLGHEHRAPQPVPDPAAPGQQPEAVQPQENGEEQRRMTALQQELGILELLDAQTAVERQVELVTTSIRERLEASVNTPTGAVVSRALFPALMRLLESHPPDLAAPLSSPPARLRSGVMDLLGRLSIPELPKQHVPELINACHAVLMTDHEGNGMPAQRVLFEVHKTYKLALEEQSGPFFEWLKLLYGSLPATYESFIAPRLAGDALEGSRGAAPAPSAPALEESRSPCGEGGASPPSPARPPAAQEAAGDRAGAPGPVIPARGSFKLAAEVAVFVVFLLQSYPKRMQQYATPLIPRMVAAAGIAGPDRDAVPAALAGLVCDMRMAQIKMLAFLTVMARPQNLQAAMLSHKDAVCAALVHVLAAAPEVVSVRKELMIALRNVLATALRPGLLPSMDLILDERLLLGASRTCYEAVRPLAFSTLAELVASVKAELSLPQLTTAMHLFIRNVNDPSAPAALQSTSLRLLYNLIETVFQRRSDPRVCEECRGLLSLILGCFVTKLRALRRAAPRFAELARLALAEQKERAAAAEAETERRRAAVLAQRRAIDARDRGLAARRRAEEAARAEAAPMETGEAAEPGDAVDVDAGGDAEMKMAYAAEATADASETPAPEASAAAVKPDPSASASSAPPRDAASEDPPAVHESAEFAAARASAYPQLVPSLASSPTAARDRELHEFRGLLQTVLSCLKSVLYTLVAFHSNRGLQAPLAFSVRPWNRFPADVRSAGRVFRHGLGALAFYRAWQPGPGAVDMRDQFADLFTVLQDGRDFVDVVGPSVGLLFEAVLEDDWYRRVFQHLLDSEQAARSGVSRHALVVLLRYLVEEKLPLLDVMDEEECARKGADEGGAGGGEADEGGSGAAAVESGSGAAAGEAAAPMAEDDDDKGDGSARKPSEESRSPAPPTAPSTATNLSTTERRQRERRLTIELFEMCMDVLPRVQASDAAKVAAASPQLPAPTTVEDATLPTLVRAARALHARLAARGLAARHHARALRALFSALSSGKFSKVQGAFGNEGLHALYVDLTLGMVMGPLARLGDEEAAAELSLLAPARLEHLIPAMPRLMGALAVALRGSDRAAAVALKVLDVWVDSFNPEFVERCMAPTIRPLMRALCAHIRPPPYPFGAKVAEILGKMGGRSRRWLLEPMEVPSKSVPEYGLRVILGFQQHTSFLVPLDRSMHFAMETLSRAREEAEEGEEKGGRVIGGGREGAATGSTDEAGARVAANTGPLPTASTAPPASLSAEAQLQLKVLELVHLCVATLVGLTRLPADCLTDAARSMARLQGTLFSPDAEPPSLPADIPWPQELGVKTKKQLQAERQMLETLLVACMAAAAGSGDDASVGDAEEEVPGDARMEDAEPKAEPAEAPDASAPAAEPLDPRAALRARARAFALAVSRHFALLFAAGWGSLTAAPAPPSSRHARYSALGGVPASVATLTHIHPHVLLDAFGAGLALKGVGERAAVLACMREFLDTLQAVGEVQERELAGKASAGGSDAADASAAAAQEKPPHPQTDAQSPTRGPVGAAAPEAPSARYVNVLQDLLMRAAHGCYGESWPKRLGGAAGARLLAERMTPAQLQRPAVPLARALLSVLRGLPSHAATQRGEVTDTLLLVLRRCLGAGAAPGADPGRQLPAAERAALLKSLTETVTRELVSSKSNDAVREAASACLGLLAAAQQTDVGGVLGAMMGRLSGIADRRMLPLRSVPAQTSYALSVAFVIERCPGALTFSPELASFLADSCSIVEGDVAKLAAGTAARGQPPCAEALARLQAACLTALVAALGWEPFRAAEGPEAVQRSEAGVEVRVPLAKLRDRVTRVFILRLGSADEEVVALCARGIKLSVALGVLQKTALQEALRPVLTDLAFYQKLTLPLLTHLHRLLDLLSGQFNVSLGDKLTEHLKKWVDVERWLAPAPPQPVAWEPGSELAIAVSMLDIFHKLPPTARRFLESQGDRPGLVVLTIGLEEGIPKLPGCLEPSRLTSPYRLPLVRFLNRYPHESAAYFLDVPSRLSKPEYFRRLLDILRMPEGAPLLDAVAGATPKLVDLLERGVPRADEDAEASGASNASNGATNNNAASLPALLGAPAPEAGAPPSLPQEPGSAGTEAQRHLAALNAVHLVRAISKLRPGWMPAEVFRAALARWRSPARAERAAAERGAPAPQQLEGRRLAQCLLSYVDTHQEEHAVLFDLLTALGAESTVDYGFIRTYLSQTVPRSYSLETKRRILARWIELHRASALSPDDQVNALRCLVNPLVAWTFEHQGAELLTPELAAALVADVFQTPEDAAAKPNELVQQELALLCAALIQHGHAFFVEHRKELIHFGWWTLKYDNAAKPAAFLCLARFFQRFPTPEKIILQVYVALLRVTQQESAAREVVRQALDAILQVFDQQREAQAPPQGVPAYARYLRRVLLEDGHITGVLVHIFSLIVRNHDLFYSSRQGEERGGDDVVTGRGSSFMSAMVHNTSKLGLPTNATLETRLLATDIAAVLLSWDARAEREAAAASKADAEGSGPDSDRASKGAADSGASGAAAAAPLAPAASLPTRGAALGGALTPAAAVPARPADHDRLHPGADELLVNFLLRMAFVSSGGEGRERDEAGYRRLHAHCLSVLRDAVSFRPPVVLKLHYFEKVLSGSLAAQAQATGGAHAAAPGASPVLVTGLEIAETLLATQPANLVSCAASQLSMMLEPALGCRTSKAPAELLARCVTLLVSRYGASGGGAEAGASSAPGGADAVDPAQPLAQRLLARTSEVLNKFLAALADPNQQLVPELLAYGCNCLVVMQAAIEADPDSMRPLIGPLLKAMHRTAREHNQHPSAGILCCKSSPQAEEPRPSEYGSGAWFMWQALRVAVPSALVLSQDHRKHFLSTLVMLITGPSVRNGQTASSIIFAVESLMEQWLLPPPPKEGPEAEGDAKPVPQLTSKEPLVFLQRLAQMERLHAVAPELRARWDSRFLNLLYTVITDARDPEFGLELFVRVERTFCCGLQSQEPELRRRFFALYSKHVPAGLFERLRYVIQVQDWDFLAHTYWLKHGVAFLFDCAHKADPITLAYNSAHVPALLDPSPSLAGPHGLPGAAAAAAAAAAVKKEVAADEPPEGDGGGPPKEASASNSRPRSPAEGGPSDAGSGPNAAAGAAAAAVASPPTSPARVGPAPSSSSTPRHQVATADVALPEGLRRSLTSHLAFLQAQASNSRSQSLVDCLIELVQGSPAAANHLWGLLFPIVWTSLAKEQQTALAKPIIQLLSREHHMRQAAHRPTVGQTLLEGVSMSQPQPKIPAEMIKYIGRHFHAWQTAISMLESHVTLFPKDMRCFDAVCDLYGLVGEPDMLAGLWQRRCAAEETRLALALQQHGYLGQAQDAFLQLAQRAVAGSGPAVTKSEMLLWHGRYLDCCAELNQWDAVAEYAKAADNCALAVDALAHQHDWPALRAALARAQVEESPELSVVRAQAALTDGPGAEVERLCKQALLQCVARWWQAPELSPWALTPVLQLFERAVELPESWRIAAEFVRKGGPGQSYQELKDICETWKLRTPNDWEPLRWWSDVLTWRNQIHDTSIAQLNSPLAIAANLHQMGYRDKAWSVNRLGRIARLHGQPDACCAIINTMYGFTAMEVQEAFVKVREQALAFLAKPDTRLPGLNLINSTNLDYFQPQHQAEMLNLKAQFLTALGEDDAAHATFSEALTLWTLCPDAWVAWARFCDARWMATKAASWLEFAAACYTQAVRLSGLEARALVPRVLHLLTLAEGGAEVVGRALASAAGDLPPWIWLPHLGPLVVSLQRPELAAARKLLSVAAHAYPQLLYWHVRPAMTQLKEAAVKAVQEARAAAAAGGGGGGDGAGASDAAQDASSPTPGGAGPASLEPDTANATTANSAMDADQPPLGSQPPLSSQPPEPSPGGDARPAPVIEKPMEVLAYEAIKEVMEVLKKRFSTPLQSLEAFMQEVASRFSTRTDERLLAVIHTLTQRTYKTGLPPSAPVPESFKKELASVCRACASGRAAGREGAEDAAGARAGPARKLAGQYQLRFARDLDPAGADAPQTLSALTERLKGWRVMLEAVVEDTCPSRLRLDSEAPLLLDLALEDVEMPGQALPTLDGPDRVFIERVGSSAEVVRRNGASYRRLTLHGSDGRERCFLVLSQQQPLAGSEDRVVSLLRAANALLDACPESRRRGLRFDGPSVLAVWPGVRLVEDSPASLSFLDVFGNHCARYGREPDDPIVAFKTRCCSNSGITSDPSVRLAAYEEVAAKLVTENVLSQHMHKTMVDPKMTWIVKKQFALSTAMAAVQCHMLLLTGRSPGKVMINRSSGCVGLTELIPTYDSRFQLERGHETVPFRLTRNMVAFMGVHGLEGVLVAALVAAGQALQATHSSLPSLLALFLRDDILAFAARRSGARSIAALAQNFKTAQLETCVDHNVGAAGERVAQLGPGPGVTAAGNPQTGARALVEAATSPANLCRMEPTWQPWF